MLPEQAYRRYVLGVPRFDSVGIQHEVPRVIGFTRRVDLLASE
jgi:hypothetical protein